MATVSINKDILENLCNFKLKWIAEEINRILAKWNARSIEQFIEDVKEGNIPEGEEQCHRSNQFTRSKRRIIRN